MVRGGFQCEMFPSHDFGLCPKPILPVVTMPATTLLVKIIGTFANQLLS